MPVIKLFVCIDDQNDQLGCCIGGVASLSHFLQPHGSNCSVGQGAQGLSLCVCVMGTIMVEV